MAKCQNISNLYFLSRVKTSMADLSVLQFNLISFSVTASQHSACFPGDIGIEDSFCCAKFLCEAAKQTSPLSIEWPRFGLVGDALASEQESFELPLLEGKVFQFPRH